MPLQQIAFECINGHQESLAGYSGKVVLIVNVASQCGLADQYAALERLYQRYSRHGLVVLGFPANDFAPQEVDSDEQIQQFCRSRYAVTFPLVKRVSVRGGNQHPLFAELVREHPQRVENPDSELKETLARQNLIPANESDVLWNFEKFVIGRNGEVIERFAPDIEPDDPRIEEVLKQQIAG